MQQWGPCAVVLAVACGVYLNTLSAGFTFDDNFAVVSPFIDPVHRGRLPSTPVTLQLSNGDIMHDNMSLLDLFRHDFWLALVSCSKRDDMDPTEKDMQPQHELEALLAALLFAVHPVHTEAVSGIVGQAELLSALLSLAALLTAMQAQDCASPGSVWRHLAVSLALIWGAALAKEIGITIVGAVILHLVYMEELTRSWRGLQRLTVQIAVLLATVATYVKLRSWLAGDQLVRIYRKVENPIPFAPPLTRVLSTGYLHTRYAALLLCPMHLSADWSFACIPLVESVLDWRNAATLLLYAALAAALLQGRPWSILVDAWQQLRAPVAATSAVMLLLGPGGRSVLAHAAQWVGLAGGSVDRPHASNSGSNSGSTSSEQQARQADGSDGAGQASGTPTVGRLWGTRAAAAGATFLALLLACASKTVLRNKDWMDEELLFIAAQKVGSISAKVCGNSAKVQLNSGILERRYQNWEAALRHFERARAIEPGYCEPDYWVGLTLVNQGRDIERGIQELERAISCKYVAFNAVSVLQKVYEAMQHGPVGHHSSLQRVQGERRQQTPTPAAQADLEDLQISAKTDLGGGAPPQNTASLVKWAEVLLRPELNRIEEACELLQQAVAGMAAAGEGPTALSGITRPCLRALKSALAVEAAAANTSQQQVTGHSSAATPMSALQLSRAQLLHLQQCFRVRQQALRTLAAQGPVAPATKAGIAKYLDGPGPGCRLMQRGEEGDRQPSSAHMHLIHLSGGEQLSNVHLMKVDLSTAMVQRADAQDALLQQEWGEILAAQGRSKEAATHLSVAAVLFTQQMAEAPHVLV
eukprot:jgi/Astpho2/8136/Aster-03071